MLSTFNHRSRPSEYEISTLRLSEAFWRQYASPKRSVANDLLTN